MNDNTPDTYAIFNEAVERESDDERSKYLDEACQGDPQVRDRVEALLHAHSGAGNFLWGQSPTIAPTLDQSAIAEKPGNYIGPYKLVEEIGEGGMGAVYMALQQEPVRRKVALKIIKPGMDSKQVVRRFEAERQALAMMDHPNIAKVHDGGTTEAGRPYFVMELVKGIPITDYADQHRQSTQDRLELFGEVCRAIQHAHQKGIIHRDLKPSNILVTELDDKATPKVIDFGIAKATHGQLMDGSLVTACSQLVGTPMYMSPEQAEPTAMDVDTRSDVYSLGVLLYELLTGTTPFDRERMSSVSFDEFRRIVREEDPPKPSTRLSTLHAALDTVAEKHHANPRTLSQQVRGELDWIVMKALEKDRSRRYESANELAKDVQRYLDDEPVEACPPSVLYRVRKYAKRHTGLLATGVLFAVTLLLATGVSAFYAIQADQQRQQAEEEKGKAVAAEQLADKRFQQSRRDCKRALDSLDTIVEELASAELAQVPGMDWMRDELLAKSLAFYEAIIREHDNAPYARQQRALAYRRILKIYKATNRLEESLAANNTSIVILEKLLQEEPTNSEVEWQLAGDLFERLHQPTRSKPEQLGDAERGLRIVERLIESDKIENTDGNVCFAAVCYFKVAERLPSDSPRVSELLEKSIRLTARHNLAPVPPVLILLGSRAEQAGDYETAERHYRRGIELFEKQGQDRSWRDSYVSRWLASNESEGSLARMLVQHNRPDDAEAVYRHALDIARQLYLEYGRLRNFQSSLIYRTRALATFLVSQGRERDATEVLHELLAEFPNFDGLHRINADVLTHQEDGPAKLKTAIDRFPQQSRCYKCEYSSLLGRQAEQAGEFETAERQYRRALDFARQLYREYGKTPAYQQALTPFAIKLADFLASQGRWNEASDMEKELFVEFPDYIERHGVHAHLLGLHEDSLAKLQAAIEHFPDEKECYEKKLYSQRGMDCKARGEYEQAKEDFEKYLELKPDDPWVRSHLAIVHLYRQSYREAIDDFALSLNETDRTNWYLFKRRAVAWFHLGQFSKAVADLDLALTMKPDDLSSVTWITPLQVAQCADESFQQAMLALAEKGVKLNDGSGDSLVARAAILLALGDKQRAQVDLKAVTSDDTADCFDLYLAAVLAANDGQQETYGLLCHTMIERFRDNQDLVELHIAAWSCVLGPCAADDLQPVLQMAERLAAQVPNGRWGLQIKGAALYRAGQFEQALQMLQRAETAPADPNTSSLYTKYLQAMTHHQMNHADEAQQTLVMALAQHDKEVSSLELIQGAHKGWHRILTLGMFRKEAQALIGDAQDK